jgi:hypothetical protein
MCAPHLIENGGLKKIQAVCAVIRKLLHANRPAKP